MADDIRTHPQYHLVLLTYLPTHYARAQRMQEILLDAAKRLGVPPSSDTMVNMLDAVEVISGSFEGDEYEAQVCRFDFQIMHLRALYPSENPLCFDETGQGCTDHAESLPRLERAPSRQAADTAAAGADELRGRAETLENSY